MQTTCTFSKAKARDSDALVLTTVHYYSFLLTGTIDARNCETRSITVHQNLPALIHCCFRRNRRKNQIRPRKMSVSARALLLPRTQALAAWRPLHWHWYSLGLRCLLVLLFRASLQVVFEDCLSLLSLAWMKQWSCLFLRLRISPRMNHVFGNMGSCSERFCGAPPTLWPYL